jgi:hypothetical protein
MPKKTSKAVTVGKAKPGDRVMVQWVLPYEIVQDVRQELHRRALATGTDPTASEVVADLLRTGLAKAKR